MSDPAERELIRLTARAEAFDDAAAVLANVGKSGAAWTDEKAFVTASYAYSNEAYLIRQRHGIPQPENRPASDPMPDLDVRGDYVIKVEKRLCALLGREWAPSGFSTKTLLDDLEARLAEALRDGEKMRADITDQSRAIIAWGKLSGENNYRIRMGGDPGEEALERENALLNEFVRRARSALTGEGHG